MSINNTCTYTHLAVGNRLHLRGQGLIWHCLNDVKAGHSVKDKTDFKLQKLASYFLQAYSSK